MTWSSPSIPWDACDEERRQDLRAVWHAGDLSYKLDRNQEKVYRAIRATHDEADTSAERWFVVDAGRRIGKDYLMACMAVETCLRVPEAHVPYGATTHKTVRDFLMPTMRHILGDCPPELRPSWNEQRKEHIFPNGSVLRFVGVNNQPENLRGNKADAVFLSECGFFRDFAEVWQAIIQPMLMTSHGAFAVLASTPPESPSHEWSSDFVPRAKSKGFYFHCTIEDNPRITAAQAEAYIEELGGREATRARRELFAEHVTEESRAIVPEFARMKSTIVVEHPRPNYFSPVVSLDVGFNDFSVAALGYYDFNNDLGVIEGEVAGSKQRAAVLDRRIAIREHELWGETPVEHRYADADPIVIAELSRDIGDAQAWWNTDDAWDGLDEETAEAVMRKIEREGGRFWGRTRKDHLQASVNALRTQIGGGRYRIHPRCSTVVAHLEHGVWKEARAGEPREFARSGKHGHFDGAAAVMYFERNLDRHSNPNPALPPHVTQETHHIPQRGRDGLTDDMRTLAAALGARRV